MASGQLANYAVDDIIVSNDGGRFQVIQLDSDNNNVYLTAEQAVEYGIADEVF